MRKMRKILATLLTITVISGTGGGCLMLRARLQGVNSVLSSTSRRMR